MQDGRLVRRHNHLLFKLPKALGGDIDGVRSLRKAVDLKLTILVRLHRLRLCCIVAAKDDLGARQRAVLGIVYDAADTAKDRGIRHRGTKQYENSTSVCHSPPSEWPTLCSGELEFSRARPDGEAGVDSGMRDKQSRPASRAPQEAPRAFEETQRRGGLQKAPTGRSVPSGAVHARTAARISGRLSSPRRRTVCDNRNTCLYSKNGPVVWQASPARAEGRTGRRPAGARLPP